ncbi:hypothetical protein V5N11_009477 [Cardamine amara subsp. amara]|uniref:Uncharacterized protein n=1 Tax=Cardamine amara subsp. amara TaxID=228776 RepID=A0ABD1A3X1_CARAN
MKSIGDGSSTRVWLDSWVFDAAPRRPYNKESRMNLRLKVSELISSDGAWRVERLRGLFLEGDIKRIMSFPPNKALKDVWIWAYSKDGKYSVKSGSCLAAQPLCVAEPILEATKRTNKLKEKKVWKVRIVSKIKLFL